MVDDEALRRVTSRVLATRGYQVSGAASCREAVGFLGAGLKADLVICEVLMPGGFELVRWLRQEHPNLKVLVASDWDGHGCEPAVAVIAKPWRLRELLDRVRELLGGRGDPESGAARSRSSGSSAHTPPRPCSPAIHTAT